MSIIDYFNRENKIMRCKSKDELLEVFFPLVFEQETLKDTINVRETEALVKSGKALNIKSADLLFRAFQLVNYADDLRDFAVEILGYTREDQFLDFANQLVEIKDRVKIDGTLFRAMLDKCPDFLVAEFFKNFGSKKFVEGKDISKMIKGIVPERQAHLVGALKEFDLSPFAGDILNNYNPLDSRALLNAFCANNVMTQEQKTKFLKDMIFDHDYAEGYVDIEKLRESIDYSYHTNNKSFGKYTEKPMAEIDVVNFVNFVMYLNSSSESRVKVNQTIADSLLDKLMNDAHIDERNVGKLIPVVKSLRDDNIPFKASNEQIIQLLPEDSYCEFIDIFRIDAKDFLPVARTLVEKANRSQKIVIEKLHTKISSEGVSQLNGIEWIAESLSDEKLDCDAIAYLLEHTKENKELTEKIIRTTSDDNFENIQKALSRGELKVDGLNTDYIMEAVKTRLDYEYQTDIAIDSLALRMIKASDNSYVNGDPSQLMDYLEETTAKSLVTDCSLKIIAVFLKDREEFVMQNHGIKKQVANRLAIEGIGECSKYPDIVTYGFKCATETTDVELM